MEHRHIGHRCFKRCLIIGFNFDDEACIGFREQQNQIQQFSIHIASDFHCRDINMSPQTTCERHLGNRGRETALAEIMTTANQPRRNRTVQFCER